MPPLPLTNFQISKCHPKKTKFNGVHSRNKLACMAKIGHL